MSQFHTLTIKNIDPVTARAVTITFDVPPHLQDKYQFKAGQYVTLKKIMNGTELRRDYSICASPQSGELKVAVKEVQDGVFSVFANHELRVGDTLEVAPPRGHFVFQPNDNKVKHLAAFAAGSGITPILSIIKCALEEEVLSNIVLVYGNKTTDEAMFFEELLTLQTQYKDRLAIQFVFSQAQEEDSIFGRIEKSTVNLILKNKHKNLSIDAFYLCGPEAMIHTVKDVLAEHGVEKERIFFELFKAAKPTEVDTATLPEGHTEITVVLDDEQTTFTMQQKETVLDAALDHDLDAPYSCQGGICSSCLARITEGEAKMRKNSILTDSEIAEGLILTCQAHPTTPKLTIDYDDI